MNTTTASTQDDIRSQVSHDQITRRARELWEQYGRPAGQDEKIWFEAEQQLIGLDSTSKQLSKTPSPGSLSTSSSSTSFASKEDKTTPRPKMLRTSNGATASQKQSSRKPNGGRRARAV